MATFSKGARVEWWGSMGSRDSYVQVGNNVYRRGRGILYTIHEGSRLMSQSFCRRSKKSHKVSPSTSRFQKRRNS